MVFEAWSVGIIFNALVSFIVGAISFAFVFFLFRRWERSDIVMRTSAWFWLMTMLLWIFSAIRYALIGFGYFSTYYYSAVYWYDMVIQAAIFFTGPPLFYYIGLRVFHRLHIAQWLSWASFFLAVFAMFFVLRPNGISEPDITYFSADSRVNMISLTMFAAEVAVGIGLLIYDLFIRMRLWFVDRSVTTLYDAMYSGPLLVYLILGALDQSKIFIDWPTIVYRLLYSTAFLMTYIMIIQQDALREEYFVEGDDSTYV